MDAKRGDWVRIHNIVLKPEERSTNLPEDTQKVPLEMWTKGELQADAEIGDTVTVKVGSVAHPMLPEHYIQWIYLLTEQGGERKILKPGDAPEAVFVMTPGDKFIAAYEYCNLHGLWKA